MCGIIGYVGRKPAQNIIIEGLRRLEYRGYDSAGLSTVVNNRLEVRKKKGRIDDLLVLLRKRPAPGSTGIGHTRWATHGPPTDVNAHPHLDQSGKIAVVHNGVIENYHHIRDRLAAAGHTFKSQTDTEVLAHLIGFYYEKIGKAELGLVEAVRLALREITGTYGIAVVHSDFPDLIVGARRGSPLLVGIGRDENFLASDANAIVGHTRRVVYLNDFEVAQVTHNDFQITTLESGSVCPQITEVEIKSEETERGAYPHYMLKEIFEQPQTLRNATRGRIAHDEATARLGGLNLTAAELRAVDRIIFVACGSALHAAMVGEYLMEDLGRIPAECEFASEFRYRNAPIEKNTLVFAISQSGETIDTLAAIRESKRRGHRTLGIVNVVGSTIAREVDGGIYMHAGPEIGVAATKTFTSQITILTLLAVLMGRMRHLSATRGAEILRELEKIPDHIDTVLQQNDLVASIAKKYCDAKGFLYLARQYNYPVALEGALKLKEISYVNAEGYPAAEMKHGPIALVDSHTPSVFICPKDSVREKVMANIEEVKARKGPVIAIATDADTEIAAKADDVVFVPRTVECLNPLLCVVPLQLFAYHIGVLRGCDVDKPRNLAKSVTVE